MKLFMVDIETLGLRAGDVVLSIGAVMFDDAHVGGEKFFEVNIDLEDSFRAGLRVDANTLLWWFRKTEAARERTFFGARKCLAEALDLFTSFLQQPYPPGGWMIMANGPQMDLVLLEHLFRITDRHIPWGHQQVMDYRTLRRFEEQILGEDPDAPERGEIAHTALADATAQMEGFRRLRARFKLLTSSLGAE